jgi:hypothetical protein
VAIGGLVGRWQQLVAVEYNGKIYNSVDGGLVWTARDSARTWSAVASSSNGTNLVAVVNGGGIYTSSDVGTNWVARTTENRLWAAVASSSNGLKLVAAEVNGFIYTSANGGTNWTQQVGSGARFWTSVAASADGTELVASTYGGKLYTSADSGVTWVARDSDRKWYAVAASADGSDLFAVVDGGLIYTSLDELVPTTFTVAEDSISFTDKNYFTATSVGPANEASQVISYVLSNDNSGLFSVQPAIAADGTLTFTTATNANGTATVTITVRDDGGTANGGVDNAPANPLSQFKVVVTPVDGRSGAGQYQCRRHRRHHLHLHGPDLHGRLQHGGRLGQQTRRELHDRNVADHRHPQGRRSPGRGGPGHHGRQSGWFDLRAGAQRQRPCGVPRLGFRWADVLAEGDQRCSRDDQLGPGQ